MAHSTSTAFSYTLSTFLVRQFYNLLMPVQLGGFLEFYCGLFRLFGVGVYGMDGLGPWAFRSLRGYIFLDPGRLEAQRGSGVHLDGVRSDDRYFKHATW